MTEASTKLYAGLDLHANNTYCAVINHAGQPLFQQRLKNELPTIVQALQPYQPQLQAVAVESTFNWYWLVDGLQAAQFPVQLANPAKIQQYSGLKRTGDQSDALWLAEMLRLGILPTGYIYPHEQRAVRDMARRRMLVVQQATRTLLSLQSMVTRHTGQTVRGRGLEDWTLVELQEAFPAVASQETAAALLELLHEQRRIEQTLAKNVVARVKLDGAWERLLSLPGVGNILGRDDHAGDRADRALCQRGRLRLVLSSGGQPLRQQRHEEGREQPQERQQVSGVGVRGSGQLRGALQCEGASVAGAQDGADIARRGREGAGVQAGQSRVLRVARRCGVQRAEDVWIEIAAATASPSWGWFTTNGCDWERSPSSAVSRTEGPLFCLLREPTRVGRSERRRASQRIVRPNEWTRNGTEAFLAPGVYGVGRDASRTVSASRTRWVTAQNRTEEARRGRESAVGRTVKPSRKGRARKASVRELFVLIGTFYG